MLVLKGLRWQPCSRDQSDCSCSEVYVDRAWGCVTPTDEPEDGYKYALDDIDSYDKARWLQDRLDVTFLLHHNHEGVPVCKGLQ